MPSQDSKKDQNWQAVSFPSFHGAASKDVPCVRPPPARELSIVELFRRSNVEAAALQQCWWELLLADIILKQKTNLPEVFAGTKH